MPAEDDGGSHGQGEDEIELLLCLLALYERLQLASSQFLKKVKALNYTKATYIEGHREEYCGQLEEPAEQPLDLRVMLNILFKATN